MKIFLFITCLIVWLPVPSLAQLSTTATTSATIVHSIEFSKLDDMKFETTKVNSADNINSGLHTSVINPNTTSSYTLQLKRNLIYLALLN